MAIIALLLFVTGQAEAQREVELTKRYLIDNATTQQVRPAEVDGLIVSSAYRSPTTGWYHIYFNQGYESLEVYNRLLNVVIKNEQVVSVTHNLIANPNLLKSVGLLKSHISAAEALQRAFADVRLNGIVAAQLKETATTKLPDGTTTKAFYALPTLANGPVEARLYWVPTNVTENGKSRTGTLTLTWNVRFLTKNGKNGWSIQVDATSGRVIQRLDEVIECDFGTPNHQTTAHDCRLTDSYFGINH